MKPLPDFLVDGTLKQAVDYLAERAAKVRTEGHTWAEKQALGLSDVMTSVGNVAKDPIVGKALLGGGIGALAGGASHYMGDQDGTPESKRKGMLGSALTGALAGGALGGGVGAVQKYWPAGAPKGPAGPAPAPTPDNFTVDPQYLRDHPEFAAKVQAAGSPSLRENAYHGLKRLGSVVTDNPIMAGVAGTTGLADLGTMYRNSAGLSRNAEFFRKGIEEAHGKASGLFASPERQELLKSLSEGPDAAARRAAALKAANPGLMSGFGGWTGLKERFNGLLSRGGSLNPDTPVADHLIKGKKMNAATSLLKKLTGSGHITAPEVATLESLATRNPSIMAAGGSSLKPGLQTLTREEARHLSQSGFRALREKGLVNKGLSTPARLLLYGAPLAAGATDFFGGGATQAKARHQTLEDLFNEANAAKAIKPGK